MYLCLSVKTNGHFCGLTVSATLIDIAYMDQCQPAASGAVPDTHEVCTSSCACNASWARKRVRVAAVKAGAVRGNEEEEDEDDEEDDDEDG